MKIFTLFFIIASLFTCVSAQTVKSVDSQYDYEANETNPFGKQNPAAPAETKQFDFMIGSFECVDKIRNPADGKFYTLKARRGAEFVLNGYAIQDKNYTQLQTSTNIRMFDPAKKEWVVSYFKAPFGIGVWRGKFDEKGVSLWKGDEKSGSKLSFFDIKPDEYSWKAEGFKDGKSTMTWQFTCKRRK